MLTTSELLAPDSIGLVAIFIPENRYFKGLKAFWQSIWSLVCLQDWRTRAWRVGAVIRTCRDMRAAGFGLLYWGLAKLHFLAFIYSRNHVLTSSVS